MDDNQKANIVESNRLTAKQEKFAQLLGTSTISQSDAYRQVYDIAKSTDKSVWELASSLANNIKVKSRIEQIKSECQVHLKYDAEAHFRELERLRNLALTPSGEHGNINISAGIRATELKGKLVGLYEQKPEINSPKSISVQIVTSGTRIDNINS